MSTLGKTSAGSTSSTSSGNKTVASKFTASATGTLDSGSAALWMDSGMTTTAKLCVYADSSGAPGSQLAESDPNTVTSTTLGHNEAFTFSGAERITITNGVDYWIAPTWQDPGTGNINYGRDGTASGRQEVNTYNPDPCGTPSAQSGPVAAYVNVIDATSSDFGEFFDFFNGA